MQKIILSDTSCLILLIKIGALNILHKLFGQVTITREISSEFKKELPDWIIIRDSKNKNYQKILEASLDKGEASAIAYAVEHDNCLLIIDDLKGRNYAKQLGIIITGTLEILIEAKKRCQIKSIKPLLEKIKQTDFRLSPKLEKKALELANEE